MTELPLAALERLLRKAGCGRVSPSACEALRELLEERAIEIGQKANLLSQHAGRKTVTGEDIRLAK
ncbi:MAG: histone family protein [Candidatus Altiarchaeota archaeon]